MILSLFITKFWRHSWTHRLWKTTIWENGRQSFHNNSHFINFRVLVSNFHILFTKSLLKVLMICQLSLFINSTFLILLISQRSLVFDTLALSSLCKLRFCSTICCFQSPCILWPHNTDGEVIHIHGEHVHDLCHVEVALIETPHCGNCRFHAFISKAPVFGSSYKSTELLALFFFMQNTLQQLVAAHSLVQMDDFLPYIIPHSSCQVLLVRWQVLTSSHRLTAWSCNHNKNQCYNQMTISVLFVMKPVQHTWHLLVHHLHDGMISK